MLSPLFQRVDWSETLVAGIEIDTCGDTGLNSRTVSTRMLLGPPSSSSSADVAYLVASPVHSGR